MVVGHTDAPFTAKPQKTHDKMRRMMRPRWPRDLDARPVDPNIVSGQFSTLFGQLALAVPTAAITAFVVLWAFTTAWTPGPSSRTADGESGPTQAAVGLDSTAPRETPKSQATSAPLRRLDREETAYLLKRGEELVAAGQLGPARLVLRRAAEAGDSDAAFALAITYDPILLRARVVFGVAPDNAMARAWYEKAKELGSMDASRRLEAIGQGR